MTSKAETDGIIRDINGQNIDRMMLHMLIDDLNNALEALSKGKISFFGQSQHRHHDENQTRNAFYKPHCTSGTELIFVIRGKVRMFINSQWMIYTPGEIWALMPMVEHTEMYYRNDLEYKLLWIIIAPGSIGFHITSYEKSRKYCVLNERAALALLQNEELSGICNNSNFIDNRMDQLEFQAILMQVLNRSIRSLNESSSPKYSYSSQVIAQVKLYIEEHYTAQISLEELASRFHYSACHLNALFREETGIAIHSYLLEKRMHLAQTLLTKEKLQIKDVAYKVGFADPLYFSRLFRRRFGKSPSDYAGKGKK